MMPIKTAPHKGVPYVDSARRALARRAPLYGVPFVVALCVVTLMADKYGDVEITAFVHSSIQLEHGGKVIHVDPWSLSDLSKAKPADLILITDDVGHHLDVKAIARVRKPGAPIVIAANGRAQVPDGIVMANGETREVAGVKIEAIGAYDIKPGDPYHPKGEANGYVVTLGGTRIYVVGVTECVPEVRAVKNVDVAFFPLNLPAGAHGAGGGDRMHPGDRAEGRLSLSLRSGMGAARARRRIAADADDARAAGAQGGSRAPQDRSQTS